MMMQLVMMSPTNTESCLESPNAYAFNTWPTTITSDAMIVDWTMMQMLVGIWFRSMLTKKLENSNTNTTAALMTRAVDIFVVMASAEQMPSTCRAIGLVLKSGSSNASRVLDISNYPGLRPGPHAAAPRGPPWRHSAPGAV